MKRQTQTTILVITGLLAVPNVAMAQTITQRMTNMNWASLYGGGTTSFNPSDSFSSNALESSFSHNMNFADSQSGVSPLSWTADVQIDINQSFNINGPLNNFASISTNQNGSKSQSAGGQIGVAGINSVLPGNELIFEFVVTSSMNYQLSADWSSTVANSSWMALAWFNGSSFQGVHDTRQLFLGTNGTFDWTGTLNAGVYRLVSQNELNNGNLVFVGQNNYTFTNLDAVPEPGTMIVIGAAALLARRRKQK